MSVAEIRWRGPRPLESEDILRGRDRELASLINKASNFDVLEITAPSGVGKSSFIAAGLIPRLRNAGREVYPSRRNWSWSAILTTYDSVTTGEIDAERLYRLCLDWPDSKTDGRSLRDRFTELHAEGHPVVVLDQFEELIRYRERLGEELLKFIGKQAAELGVTHIIAGRSEYRDQFRLVEKTTKSFFHWSLPEINDDAALADIIKLPVLDAGLEIDDEVIRRLRDWWNAARSDDVPGSDSSFAGRTDVGLLHLQGVLWLFKTWLKIHAPSVSKITVEHLELFAVEYVAGADDVNGPRLYRTGLVEYVREQCKTFHKSVDGSESWSPGYQAGRGVWLNGPRLMMARSAHLFSVLGYKVAQSQSGMFRTVLAEDLDPAMARAVSEEAGRSSSGDWIADIARKYSREVTGTVFARGWSGDEVLNELLAAAVQAWSAAAGEANILRRFVQKDDEVYELVHDGMGMALQEWANRELGEPSAIIGVITPRTGRTFAIPIEPDTFASADDEPYYLDGIVGLDTEGQDGRIRIDGVGWSASVITSSLTDVTMDRCTVTGALFRDSTMRDVVFRRCDLKGAAFHAVNMEHVRFEECILQGAAFRNCTMSDVEFVCPDGDGTVSEFSTLDLLSFENCDASAAGVSFRSLRETVGLIFRGVTGGPWVVEGTGVRHLALHGRNDAAFRLKKGTYEHMTVEPAGLVVDVDRGVEITHSDSVNTRPTPA